MPVFLERTVADLDQAHASMAREMLPHYGAQPGEVWDDPREELSLFDDQRGEQTVTLLQSLGYLAEPNAAAKAAGEHVWPIKDIEMAWADWRHQREALEAESKPAVCIGTGESTTSTTRIDQLRRDLKACATLEGEVSLTRWPAPGEKSLATRIALMRLRLFGLADRAADSPMPKNAGNELVKRGRRLVALTEFSAVDLINRLGDLPGLTLGVREQLDGNLAVLSSPGQTSGPAPTTVAPLLVQAGAKVTALNPANTRKVALNRFSLRLFQIRLWTLGYYQGEIDGDWGKWSGKALDTFVNDMKLGERNRLMGKVQGGFVVIDISKLLAAFTKHVDSPADKLDRSDIDQVLSDAQVRRDDELWEMLSAAHKDDPAGGKGAAPSAELTWNGLRMVSAGNVRRRRYFGWRGIFAAFGRFVRGIVDKAAKFATRLKDALKKSIELARNAVRYVVDCTRVCARIVSLAAHRLHCWFHGTPVVTLTPTEVVDSAGIATCWRQDFDTVHVVSPSCPAETVTRHGQVLGWMQRSFRIMVTIGRTLLGAILAMGNWLMFAWRALRIVRQLVQTSRDPIFAELLSETAPT